MGQDFANIDLATIEMHGGFESVVIPASIENDVFSDEICMWERLAQMCKRSNGGCRNYVVPGHQREGAVMMSTRKLS